MTLDGAVKYAEEHIEEIQVGKLCWEEDMGTLDPKECYFLEGEPPTWRMEERNGHTTYLLSFGAKEYIRLTSMEEIDMENCFYMQYAKNDVLVFRSGFKDVTLEEAKKKAVNKVLEYLASRVEKYGHDLEETKDSIFELGLLAATKKQGNAVGTT